MAGALHPAAEPAEIGPGSAAGVLPAVPRAMTRCECAEVSFQEVARQVASGRPLEETLRRTGCAQNCTACLPDLLKHLASSL
jgi:hypothetical protein